MKAPLFDLSATLTLRTVYPCCNGVSRVPVIPVLPRERYFKTCPRCGQAWDVRREGHTIHTDGSRIDVLTWQEAAR